MVAAFAGSSAFPFRRAPNQQSPSTNAVNQPGFLLKTEIHYGQRTKHACRAQEREREIYTLICVCFDSPQTLLRAAKKGTHSSTAHSNDLQLANFYLCLVPHGSFSQY